MPAYRLPEVSRVSLLTNRTFEAWDISQEAGSDGYYQKQAYRNGQVSTPVCSGGHESQNYQLTRVERDAGTAPCDRSM